MVTITRRRFEQLINEALDSLPQAHVSKLENVAILCQDEPTPEQRKRLGLKPDQTLFGLYEGVPAPGRQGLPTALPDRITLFTGPLSRSALSEAGLKEEIRHTLWHEIAHYFGLEHERIAELEGD